MADIELKQREAKTITFTVTQDGSSIDVSGGEYKFAVKKEKSDAAYLIEKDTNEFDDSSASSGILRCPVDESDTDLDAGEYVAELMIDLSGSSSGADGGIDKSQDLSMEIIQAVITS